MSRRAFTLMEVMLVIVIVAIITGVSLPYFSGTIKGAGLKTTARTISRMSRYARSMAIMREEMMTIVLNQETMEIFLGGELVQTNSADGEIDQDILKRLGYKDGEGTSDETAGIEKEVHKILPKGLTVREFDKEWTEEDDEYPDLCLIRFFPNGQCEKFEIEIEDKRGVAIRMENDPISGKITSEFLQ
ncbi:pilus assembly FimT family protein [Pontiella agarivorans]|uniref:Prepilin-type N-terminal cleavage/methylation domain-containing protein n=1 Tax=Pontiella agarivorans TaxID=3038953 RepID=A0ABU5MWC0_9BACT|nr:prepilin-type N-terminal cleavage/methylation domain-containing protein [Pontiella agarivorans]MDZ8118423.1 prepilin-type N-terminal cleavage/methylation domain-containing protein [Pontiella agarivorans]